ncbi:virulence factor [Bacillus ginsengihumi]|uniref:Virulence factor n=1 Tax=Heyndrickxia ginsengihumi TaxID=363870 RepID=A0A0A6VEQ6_9BACI|nr:conserved virulence factor C family protein [Heyndrickxia ginsengihumi]KHD86061.1 virulence factor [Heyndrickxia ginsengihumi]MBE6184221.1 virulence factor [Bacillus sp. (in: firmicutes)]NEY20361.1 virulence factor [Heyndrickxia ginsengihumi]
MNIKAIEPTPSPNTMKVILTEELPSGKRNNYKKEQLEEAPDLIRRILQIDGVKGVYHVADFLAVERVGKVDWKEILPKVREAFGEEQSHSNQEEVMNEHFGEVNVAIQMFKDIPLQVKLTDGEQEKRFGLPDYFVHAMKSATLDGDNYVLLRKWKDWGVRYGELEQIGHDVVEELLAAYPQERINTLVEQAQNPTKPIKKKQLIKVTSDMLDVPDWRKRYQLLEQMETPTLQDLPVLEKALKDEKPSIRRLAVVYLGMIKDKQVLSYLYKGLEDGNVTVRRTAGDALSDLGFKEAIAPMAKLLQDPSKIVRWRAAMFLYEEGDESALPALKQAENDPEFEVQLQIKMAIERITNGQEAKGSVWKQMTEARKNQPN